MKKILTAMTAVSLTLQASDKLNQDLDFKDEENNGSTINANSSIINQLGLYFKDNTNYSGADKNDSTLGASGSFFVSKSVRLGFDNDLSNSVTAGDVLIYDIMAENTGELNASGAFLDDIPDSKTSLVPGSVATTQGNILVGNTANDAKVEIDIGNITSNSSTLVSFAVTINPIPDGEIVDISNQAFVSTINLGLFASDDVFNITSLSDPTVIKAYGNPTPLYNEAEDGDFLEHYQTPTPLVLNTEIERITGTVGGRNLDFEDCFQFNVTTSRVVNAINLENYAVSNGNLSSLFQVFTGLPPLKVAIGDIINRQISQNDIGTNLLFDFQTLGTGTYSVCLVEGTPGQTYSLLILSDITDNIFSNSFE